MSAYEELQAAISNHVPVKDVARLYVAYVHAELGSNKVHTAKKLRIDRRTLQRWGVDLRG